MNMTTEPNLTVEPNTNLSINTTGDISRQPPLIFINNILTNKLLPLTVILWIYLVVGVLGNSLVMFVYWARKKPVREDRYFIPVLALVDMASCVVSSSTGIYAQTYPLMFENDTGCKLAAFLGILFANLSADFLLIIAIERFMKLCRPFGAPMTMFKRKVAIVLICVLGLAISTPSLGVYRTEQIDRPMGGGFIKVSLCMDTRNTDYETAHMVYKVFLFVVAIARCLVLFVSYGSIVYTLSRHSTLFRQRMGSFMSCTSTTPSISDDVRRPMEMRKMNGTENRSEDGDKERKQTESIKKQNKGLAADRMFSRRKSSTPPLGKLGRKESVVDRQGVRLTVIFLLITVIYIITYGPKVWLMIEQSINRNFWFTIPESHFVLYRFLHSFYIFNNVVNPIVYGVLDKRFKQDCKKRFFKRK
ncbi:orexin/Hypocretin receptor type 1-like [Argopecten irradians]|uniref:orexin/Hypocretin receptor type 1-like n=1 Tax=Argopecten irradians TaxID=31199 RepID=UPI00371D290B